MKLNDLKRYIGITFSTKTENCLLDCSQLILRLSFSGLLLTHGWAKLSQFSAKAQHFPDPIGLGSECTLVLAILVEFFASLFIAAGLFTRAAALSVVTTMLVIVFIFHGSDPFSQKELALLYGFAFISIMVAGGGRWSLDRLIHRRFK